MHVIANIIKKIFFIVMLILHVWFPSDGEGVIEGGGGREGRRGRGRRKGGGREVFCAICFRSNIVRRNRDVVPPCQ